MNPTAPRLILIKSDVKIAHQAGYALWGGRWHKVSHDKPAPKGAPLAAHPTAAGVHAPVKHFTDEQWAQLKLPPENVNAPSYNKKLAQLKEWSEAGDVTAIVGSGYGTNTYGKKLATIANSLLGLHGSPHKVAAGQQPGWHAAVEHAPAAASQAAPQIEAAPAATGEPEVPLSVKQSIDQLVADDSWGLVNMCATQSKDPHVVAYAKWVLSKKPAAPAAAPASPAIATGTVFKIDSQYAKMSKGEWKVYNQDGDQYYMHKVGAKVPNQTNSATIPKATLHEAVAKGTAKMAEPAPPSSAEKLIDHVAGAMKGAAPAAVTDPTSSLKEKLELALTLAPGASHKNQIEAALDSIKKFGEKPKGLFAQTMQGNAKAVAEMVIAKHSKAAPAPAEPAPPAGKVTADIEFPDFPEHYKATPFYKKVAYHLAELADAGDLEGLKAANDGSSAWQGGSPNSEKLLAYYGALMEKVSAAPKPARVKPSGPKEGDIKQGEGGTLVLKNGHWVLSAADNSASLYLSDSIDGPHTIKEAATAWLQANPGKEKELSSSLAGLGFHQTAKDMGIYKPPGTPAPLPAGNALLAQIPWDKQFLPPENSNASSHNKAVTKIKALAEAGDEAGLAAIVSTKSGAKQTYAKKQGLLAQAALAALKEGAAAPAALAAKPTQDLTEVAAWKHILDAVNGGGKPKDAADAWFAANPEGGKELNEVLSSLAYGYLASYPTTPHKPLSATPTGVPAYDYLAHSFKAGGLVNSAAVKWLAANPGGEKELDLALVDHGYGSLAGYSNKPADVSVPVHLIEGWKAAVKAGEVPTKEQAQAIDKLQQLDEDSYIEAHMDAIHESTASDPDAPDWDAEVSAAEAKIAALHNHALNGTKPDTGPQNGDTKPGANGGTLVFKDGHWHLQEEAAPFKSIKTTLHNTTAGHSKEWSGHIAPNASGGWDLVTEYGKIGGTQQKTEKPFASQVGANQALTKLMGAKMKDGYEHHSSATISVKNYATGAAQAQAVASAAPAPKAAPAPATPAPGAIPSMDAWTQTGPQGGSNPGGKFKSPDGTEWYCKFPENDDIAKSEVLAAKLYAAAGLAGQDAQLVTKDGKVGIASKWVDVKKGKTTAALAKAPDACGGFAVDAWLANWDVVGLGYDNLQLGTDGKAVRVDAGGSLEYRAQGSKKPFGNQVDEIDTLRDTAKNPQAAAVFGKMTKADITASVAKVLAVSDQQIKDLVNQFGPGDAAAKKKMVDTLIARKADLLAKYPKAALAVKKGGSWIKLGPGETVVETGEKFGVEWAKIRVPAKGFQASAIPAPPNFFMNGSQGATGTWKSSVKHVNETNNEAGQAIFDAAMEHKKAGPVQGLLFDQIDKSTGLKTGVKLPFSQHPAGEIKEYFNQVTAELQAQTQHTYKTVQNGSFTQSYSAAAASMAAEFSPKDYSAFKAHAAKAADYLVLSKSAAAGLPAPEEGAFEEQWENASPKLIAFKKECTDKFQSLSSSEQAACKSYTGSSYANWNQALRSGDTTSNAYQSAQAMVKGMKKAAIDIPEGTILWRGIGVGEDTYKSVAGAIIQDGSFQSSSFGSAPAFSSHKTWLKIHVGKGVKGLHATAFSIFGSGEREIIIKNNVRYAVLKVTKHDNFIDSKGKSHGPKTIVDLLALPHED